MVLQAIVWTVLAWVAGLLLDANLSLQPAAFSACASCFRFLRWGFAFCVRSGKTETNEWSKAPAGFRGRFFCGLSEARSGRQMRRLAER